MLHTLFFLATLQGASPAPLSTAEIVERMIHADEDRRAALAGYTGMRRYHFENTRVNKHADMTVRIKCTSTGVKTFEVLYESGSGTIRDRILRKMIDAEAEASQTGEHEGTRIIPANYDFRLVGTETTDGRTSYVLEISPKTKNKFLIRGRIWVHADEFAITRVEGQPAKSPSFWIRSVHVLQKYGQTGRFWLPVMNESTAEARIFGRTNVSIEYFDYVPTMREAGADTRNPKEWKQ